jgi:succinate dehydrogenase / fumarate reductase cytochrome b subunit
MALPVTQQDMSSAPTRQVNGPTRRRSLWPLEFYRSAVGKKWVMAVTGIALVGFVLFHMVGNLKAYLGAEDINHYGEFLRELLVPLVPRTVALWLLRTGLIVAFALHIHAAYSLTVLNHRARPVKYATQRDYVAANWASRTMRWTGVIVGLFVLFHLGDLTWGFSGTFVRGDPYNNMVLSFRRVPVAIIYVLANVALGFHLFHGVWSLFQSLGWNNPRFNNWRIGLARGIAGIVLVGNLSFPLMATFRVLDTDWDARVKVCEVSHDNGDPCQHARDEVAKENKAVAPSASASTSEVAK